MNSKKFKQHLFRLLKTLIIFVFVFVLVGIWRTRNLPEPLELHKCLEPIMVTNMLGEKTTGSSLVRRNHLIYFWAPWCGVCKYSGPGLQNYVNNLGKLSFINVGMDGGSEQSYREFAMYAGFDPGSTYFASDELRACFSAIDAYPTYYMISHSGERALATKGLAFHWMLWVYSIFARWM